MSSTFPWLLFNLAESHFAVSCENVTGIVILPPKIIQPVLTPEFIRGLLDLRGEVIPLVDMRELFKFKALHDEQSETRIENDLKEMVITIANGDRKIGLIVDEVNSVEHLERVSDAVNIDLAHIAHYFSGVARSPRSKEVIFLLEETKLCDLFSGDANDLMAAAGQDDLFASDLMANHDLLFESSEPALSGVES